MSPDWHKTDVDRVPIPWWTIASVALLGVALGISLKNNHTWDAAIIAALLMLGILVVAAVIRLGLKARRNDAARRR